MSAAMTPSHDWYHERRYVVVVDAGSSGSRLMVYSWRSAAWERDMRMARGEPLNVLPHLERGSGPTVSAPWQVKIEPGFSSFAGRTQDIRGYMDQLLTYVRSVVPPDALPHTPIYIMATAGMRMLKPEVRQAILLETCRVIREQPFYFASDLQDYAGADTDTACGGHVRVITGEEEGMLGWLAVNYLMHEFGPQASTVGFLDMGGASSQIAFVPDSHYENQRDLFHVTLHRLDASVDMHNVFVTTFLGYGTNAARTRYLYALAERLGAPMTLPDPCLPKGLRIPMENGASTVHGTGSYADCLAEQQLLLDRQAKCSQLPCPFHGVHVPPIDFHKKPFVGVSEYWYSTDDVFRMGGVYDHDQFHRMASDFCASDWSALESKWNAHEYPEQVTSSRLQMQCFKSAWMSTILHEGFQLPRASNLTTFQSLNSLHGLSVSWTLGKALLEASRDVSTLKPVPAAPSAPFSWVLWIGVGLALFFVYRKLYRRTNWLPLRDRDPTEAHDLTVTIPTNDDGAVASPPSRRPSAVRIVPRHLACERPEQLANAGFPSISKAGAPTLMTQLDASTAVVPTGVSRTSSPSSFAPRTPTYNPEAASSDAYVMSTSVALGRARSPMPPASPAIPSPSMTPLKHARASPSHLGTPTSATASFSTEIRGRVSPAPPWTEREANATSEFRM